MFIYEIYFKYYSTKWIKGNKNYNRLQNTHLNIFSLNKSKLKQNDKKRL